MKTIALIDPFWTGHHSTYMKLFSKALLSLGHTAMAFCPYPHEVEQWITENCEHNSSRFRGFELREPEPSRFPLQPVQKVLNDTSLWRSAAKAIKMAHRQTGILPDLVFFPWLDDYLGRHRKPWIIDLIFPYPWSGLYFFPWYLRQYVDDADNPGPPTELEATRCHAIGLLDEGIAGRMQELLLNKKVVAFPDIADDSPPDRDFPLYQHIVAKARGRKIVSLLGGIAKRKGVLTLLEAAAQMSPDECLFLFAGPLYEQAFDPGEVPAIRRVAADPPDNCLFHLGFVPGETQFNALVELSDILFAGYVNFPHSSNLLAKAALFEKPVIASRGYCMEERVKAFRLGECIGEGDVSECMTAIRQLLKTHDADRDFTGYRSLHSEERFRSALQTLLADGR